MNRAIVYAALAVALVMPGASYAVEPAYVDSVSALTVSLAGDNAHAVINLLTGIQYLLWMIIGGLGALAVLLGIQVWRWQPATGA
jgi:hypothetical protein